MLSGTHRDNTNLIFYRGDTAIRKFIIRDKNGEPYDLSGMIIKSQARQTPDSEDTLFDITIEDQSDDGSEFEDGIVVLRVPSSVTSELPPQCVYDIEAKAGELTITIARGTITLIPDVTR